MDLVSCVIAVLLGLVGGKAAFNRARIRIGWKIGPEGRGSGALALFVVLPASLIFGLISAQCICGVWTLLYHVLPPWAGNSLQVPAAAFLCWRLWKMNQPGVKPTAS